MAVTSFVRDRGRAIGVVAALTASVALASAPAAFGAVDGDPIASSIFTFKLSGGFKSQLAANGVKMKPKVLKLTKGDVDPTTGAGDLRFGKVTFKKGNEKVVFGNLKGSMPGKISSSNGKIFQLTAPTGTVRNGFGADLTGVKVKLLKSAAKKINKALGLHSLHKGTAGSFSLAYQPTTVKVISGTASVEGSLVGGSVGIKFLVAHCVNGTVANGITPIAPATEDTATLTFTFPVLGGTIAPDGTSGVVQQGGGVKNNKNNVAGPCANGFSGTLDLTNFAVNLGLQNIQSNANILAAPPGVFTGDRGVAIGQTTDPAGVTVTADATAHTITVDGALIRINEVSAGLLNLIFPNVSGNPNNDFKNGDPFGTSNLTVTTR